MCFRSGSALTAALRAVGVQNRVDVRLSAGAGAVLEIGRLDDAFQTSVVVASGRHRQSPESGDLEFSFEGLTVSSAVAPDSPTFRPACLKGFVDAVLATLAADEQEDGLLRVGAVRALLDHFGPEFVEVADDDVGIVLVTDLVAPDLLGPQLFPAFEVGPPARPSEVKTLQEGLARYPPETWMGAGRSGQYRCLERFYAEEGRLVLFGGDCFDTYVGVGPWQSAPK